MTQTATATEGTGAPTTEHFDVIIIGAGISGVGAAYHLQDQLPGKSFVVLEALEEFGGTWRMHTYPGIRSDSDLYTFGYRFKPWTGPPIATGPEILKYMGEVIDENDLGRHIRYSHRIARADWSSDTNTWTLEGTRTGTRRATPRTGRAWSSSAGASCTRRPGPTTSTCTTARCWSSVRVRRRRPSCPRSRGTAST
jgi:phytoene dehydrogenase-like protein